MIVSMEPPARYEIQPGVVRIYPVKKQVLRPPAPPPYLSPTPVATPQMFVISQATGSFSVDHRERDDADTAREADNPVNP